MCPICAAPTLKSSTGPQSTYCSKRCRNRAAYLRRKEAGTHYRPQRKEVTERPCIQCGEPFSAKRDDARVCSKRCHGRWLDRNNPVRCSDSECDRGVRAKGLCSMHWRRLARAEGREKADVWDERRRSNWKKRYALTRGAPEAESFDYRAIHERDDWVCGICGEAVDPELKWPDPMSASLDHIVPVSQGGVHSPANAQCSHLTCNVHKGVRVA